MTFAKGSRSWRRWELETVQWRPITYSERLSNSAVRGVYPVYGDIRNQVAGEGRWISGEDMQERRRVVFLGYDLREDLFGGRPAIGETVRISGVRFTVIGSSDRKMQLSNYFGSDDNSAFIPYTTAGDLWDNRYASVMVFSPIAPQFEANAKQQVRAAVAKRQRFSPTDERAMNMFGREQFRPIIDGITIGLRRALGARKSHIRTQFLCEALVITAAGGLLGMALAYLVAALVGTLPMLGPLFQDESGKRDIHLVISPAIALISTGILVLVGVLSGLVPALRASRLEPSTALRYE